MLEWKDENKQLKEKLKIKTLNRELEYVTFQPKINKKSVSIVKNRKCKIDNNDSIPLSNVSNLSTNRSTNNMSTNRSNTSEE
jgi:ribonuclease HIII